MSLPPRSPFLFAILLLIVVGAVAPPAWGQEDHPLLSRYEGSLIDSKKVEEFGQYKFVNGVKNNEPVGEELKGRVTRIVYQNPQNRSTLEIFTNYQAALNQAGLAVAYTCAVNDCGPAFARSAWNRFNGLFAAADGDPRYLGGKVTSSKGTAYVAVMVGRARTQLDIVEIVAMEGELVLADAGALAAGITREGKVSVYGILFDTDKSEIKPESKPALDEIAKLLRNLPELRIFVVGHTDMTGELARNQSLSEARAQAVVKSLVTDYGIAAARMAPYGVGPLAPVAANSNPAERAKNRRVELVAR